jgi:6-pyruvoyltetrahydropterin/6-carboxytetrahydropterin synthase
MEGLGAYSEVVITCRGEVDPRLGYLVDIQQIDRLARETLLPRLARAMRETPGAQPGDVLADGLHEFARALPVTLVSVRWRLSPFYSVEVRMAEQGTALLRQTFDFAASHRLHCHDLSDEENRRLFGKCNNPNGHGHNYQVQACVEVPVGGTRPLRLSDLERLVDETIIRRFDHKNLNEDVPEFRHPGGVNPSVENIAKVSYELLDAAMRGSGAGGRLRSITVWETDRTSAVYPAGTGESGAPGGR